MYAALKHGPSELGDKHFGASADFNGLTECHQQMTLLRKVIAAKVKDGDGVLRNQFTIGLFLNAENAGAVVEQIFGAKVFSPRLCVYAYK